MPPLKITSVFCSYYVIVHLTVHVKAEFPVHLIALQLLISEC